MEVENDKTRSIESCPPPDTAHVATLGRTFKGRFYNFLGLVSKKHCYFGKALGFTLAEVLITLGIIGIVAALTIPGMIHKHRIMVLENQFKKAYSLLQNVHMAMINDDINPYEEYVQNRDEQKASKQVEDFAKYTSGSTICNDHYIICTGHVRWKSKKEYKTLDGKNRAHIDADAYTKKTILLADGMTLWVGGLVFEGHRYYIDINGTDKAPNRLGYDLFTFTINSKNNHLEPEKEKGTINKCSFVEAAHSPAYLGFGCAHYAAADQNPDSADKYWKKFLK